MRFLAFDAYKNLLADETGHVSGPKTVLAGFGAGVTESLLAVTPFESIKTQMYPAIHPTAPRSSLIDLYQTSIDDRKSGKPR